MIYLVGSQYTVGSTRYWRPAKVERVTGKQVIVRDPNGRVVRVWRDRWHLLGDYGCHVTLTRPEGDGYKPFSNIAGHPWVTGESA